MTYEDEDVARMMRLEDMLGRMTTALEVLVLFQANDHLSVVEYSMVADHVRKDSTTHRLATVVEVIRDLLPDGYGEVPTPPKVSPLRSVPTGDDS